MGFFNQKEAQENLLRNKKIVLIDVREKEEYEEGHIKGAHLVPFQCIINEIEELAPDMETIVYLYCHSGVRSERAKYVLNHLGYTNVYNLGGIITWPYELEH